MILREVGMIAADTSRTLCYLKELIKNNLYPNFIILLLNQGKDILPGQSEIPLNDELFLLLDNENLNYEIALNSDINSINVIEMISNRTESVFIFSGFGGVILKNPILEIGVSFLHVHGGYLPDFKGSTTNYYSLIIENKLGASSIFLSNKLDSGSILVRRKFRAPKDRTQIDHIHDSKVRAKVLIETLLEYCKSGKWIFDPENNLNGQTYYIIHPVLKHIAILGNKVTP